MPLRHTSTIRTSYKVNLTHLQVRQQPREVQTPFGSVPVVIRTDVFKTSVSEHTVVVL